MGKYSVRGSASFDQLIDQHMNQIADAVWELNGAPHWNALVLLGGYGRGEGTPLRGPGGEQPFNDYDLVVVTDRIDRAIRSELTQLEQRLSAELGLPVDLYPYRAQKLSRCEFSLLNYEMKYGHRVIRGDPAILDAMPNYPHEAIPPAEGTRLLMNRGKLLLDIQRRLAAPEPLTEEEHVRFVKFILKTDLALGDCALLLRNRYHISYTVKKERISTIDLDGIADPNALINGYLKAIAFKESGDLSPYKTADIPSWLRESIARLIDLFLWYEGRVQKKRFCDATAYARAFPHLGNEGFWLKNGALNLRTWGVRSGAHLWVHPRRRLYAALLLLLSETDDLARIRALLAARSTAREALCDTFLTLQRRFS